ncbi:hypothetical protein SteCoe_12698 [Stentor coeruleus]|uniref:Uncharacterized protein n=1 Tax=Stentor coeruleus TaxID=5963 RepID=A0A1R2CA97_9CILI|nr:hypothetical protein SteCoe_12698 [Stentor coeruleus]
MSVSIQDSSSNLEDLVIESVPFKSLDHEEHKSNHSNSSNLPSVCSEESSIPTQNFMENYPMRALEMEKESWRSENKKNVFRIKEYEILVNELQDEMTKIASNKSDNLASNRESDTVTISRTDLAEFEYQKLILEKEVKGLKNTLSNKDSEIKNLTKEIESLNQDLPLKSNEKNLIRKKKPLAPFDSNIPFLNAKMKNEKLDFDDEKSIVVKRLHESLKINDSLAKSVYDLEEKLKEKERELSRISREPGYSLRKPSQNFSISSFLPIEQNFSTGEIENLKTDLDISEKKCEELSQEIESYEIELKEYQNKITSLNKKLEKKENDVEKLHLSLKEYYKTVQELQKNNDALNAQIVCQKREFDHLQNACKNYENQLRIQENEKKVIEKEVKITIERSQQEITDLKRSIDIIRNEKESLEYRLKDYEELKGKVSSISNNHEFSKNNEIKLLEEISGLKTKLNAQEMHLSTSGARITKLQNQCQTLETEHASCKKLLSEKDSQSALMNEKIHKLQIKLEKRQQKIKKIKQETLNKYSDYKEISRNYMAEKSHASKLIEQNNELKHYIKNVEDIRDKLLEKVDSLNSLKGECLAKIKYLEETLSSFHYEKKDTMSCMSADLIKLQDEVASLKSEIKKKNEEILIAKALNRKMLQEFTECSQKVSKNEEQENFYQNLLKSSEAEIKRISDRLGSSLNINEEQELKIKNLSSELMLSKNQINLLANDLKKVENACRLMNLEKYSFISKIEELERFKGKCNCESTVKDEYYKLVRAYQSLTEEMRLMKEAAERGHDKGTFETFRSRTTSEFDKYKSN